jgi:ribosomal protein L27
VIAEAEFVSKKVFKDSDGRIITLNRLRVKDGLKGSKPGEEIVISQLGGELNGRVMRIQGMSRYRPGEQVIIFAIKGTKYFSGYGVGLGKFNIIKTHHGGEVIEDIHDIGVFSRVAGQMQIREPNPRKYPSLEEFKAEIRGAL